jgi:hypothetical protein
MLVATGIVSGDSHVVTVSMDEASDSGQSGTATLTAQGSSTGVVVSLSAGALQSELIHSGSCEKPVRRCSSPQRLLRRVRRVQHHGERHPG